MASPEFTRWKVVQNHKVDLADSEGRLAPLNHQCPEPLWLSPGHLGICFRVPLHELTQPLPKVRSKMLSKGNQSYIISSNILIWFCTRGEKITSNKLVNTGSSFIQKTQNLDGFQWCKPSNREWKGEQESLFSPFAVDTVTKEVCGLHRGLRIAR